jgi:hypothetical protein
MIAWFFLGYEIWRGIFDFPTLILTGSVFLFLFFGILVALALGVYLCFFPVGYGVIHSWLLILCFSLTCTIRQLPSFGHDVCTSLAPIVCICV